MTKKKFWVASGKVVAVATAIVVVSLMSVPRAGAATQFKTLHRFTGGADGGNPHAGLIVDQAGNLYGTTWAGGNLSFCGGSGCGVVFELTPTRHGGWKETVLHRFKGGDTDGANPPEGRLVLDAAGNLYGVTHNGGRYGYGVIFKLKPSTEGSWTERVLHNFSGGSDGAYPYGSLILDTDDNLYGTTTFGSNKYCGMGCGVVFELTRNPEGRWKEKVLHAFAWSDGAYPVTPLVFDPQGNLYGTAWMGGSSGQYGLIFRLAPNPDGSWTETVLHNFTGGDDGGNSRGGLLLDGGGNLYGTTADWGASCCGVAFELTPSGGSWTEQVVHHFQGGEGGDNPWAALVFDQAGNLYGTTRSGGNLSGCGGQGCGVVFKLTPDGNGGWKKSSLHTFADDPGASPWTGLIIDGLGNLYGTTYGDGSTTFGTVYEITP